jgi:gliding motility-associated-like protein
VVIRAQRPELANAGADIFTCSTSNIKLNAVKGITAQGFWTQSLQQAQILGIVIDNPDDPQSGISGVLNRGQNYTFTWNIGNDGCGFATDNVTVFIWSPKPYAGADQFVCSAENCANLSASSLASFEGGRWSSNDISITFNPMNTPNTKVCGLKQGKNIVYWTTNNGVCGNDSRDTVEIHYELFPTAVDDIVPVPFGSTATFNVLANDILPATSVVELVVTVPPASGTILDLGNGNFTYRPSTGFTGSETMTYRIRNTNCAEAISFGTVTFTVGAAGDCFVPSIITPNNDGYNDFFVVPTSCVFGGEGPEDVEVTIFNQWGDAVYHAKPYNNDWGGTYNSEDLPAGTYFFVVRIGDNAKPLTGFLLIQR